VGVLRRFPRRTHSTPGYPLAGGAPRCRLGLHLECKSVLEIRRDLLEKKKPSTVLVDGFCRWNYWPRLYLERLQGDGTGKERGTRKDGAQDVGRPRCALGRYRTEGRVIDTTLKNDQ
jgi:hypothetical protein